MKKATQAAYLWFLLPAGLCMVGFLLLPLGKLAVDSLFSIDAMAPDARDYVGFANYAKAFASSRFLKTLTNTAAYVVIAVSVEFVLGLLAALLLSSNFKGSNLVRTITLTPLMISQLVAGLIWKLMLSSQFGILNQFLVSIGALANINSILWLADERYALLACCIADIWLTAPYMMLFLLAGIQSIDKGYLEAARVDGAGPVRVFWQIMLPALRPVITVSLLIRVIDAARSFAIIWAMTEGGPNFASELLSTYIYKMLTRYGEIGYASAMAMVFLLLLLALTLMFLKVIWRPREAV